jgi:hypothetical protein
MTKTDINTNADVEATYYATNQVCAGGSRTGFGQNFRLGFDPRPVTGGPVRNRGFLPGPVRCETYWLPAFSTAIDAHLPTYWT